MSLSDIKLNHLNDKYKEIEPSITSYGFMDRQTILFLVEKVLQGNMDAYIIYVTFMWEPLAKANKNFLLFVFNHFLENPIARCAIIWINFCLLDDDESCIDNDTLQEMIDAHNLHALYLKGYMISDRKSIHHNEENKYWEKASLLGMGLATSSLAQDIIEYSSVVQLNEFELAYKNQDENVLNDLCDIPPNDTLYEKKIDLLIKAIEYGDKRAYLYLGDHYSLMKDNDLAITYYHNYLYFLEEWHMLLVDEINYVNELLSEIKKSSAN